MGYENFAQSVASDIITLIFLTEVPAILGED